MKITLTKKSSNPKTGPIPVSMSDASTCPATCPFKGKACYGAFGPLSWQWKKVKGSWAQFIFGVLSLPAGTFWRHNQVGDLPGVSNGIDVAKLRQLVVANTDKQGFTYTHKPVIDGQAPERVVVKNRQAIAEANRGGFTVNLSANNLNEVDSLVELGIGPVVTALPEKQLANVATPKGRRVVVCPAAFRAIQCVNCRLCQKANRSVVVGFPAHGTFKKLASGIASS
jgi:hypothetical protein